MKVSVLWLALLAFFLGTPGHSQDICVNKNFRRRPDHDDTLYTESFLSSSSGTNRTSCLRKCTEEAKCQLIMFNPSSQSCRLHFAVLTGGSYEEGWIYHGIDCSSIDSCSSGYIVISNSVSTCYRNGEWTSIHGRSECALFPGPYEHFKRTVDKPIEPGVRISIELETGYESSSYIYFRNAPVFYIPLRMIFYWTKVTLERFDGSSVIDKIDITTPTIPENTNITVEFLFSDNNVTIYVDTEEFATYGMVTDWSLIEYLYIYRFNRVYKLTYD